MNNPPKIVVSNKLTTADWQNSRIVRGDELAAELHGVKQQDGKNTGTVSSAILVRSLLRDGLLDELHKSRATHRGLSWTPVWDGGPRPWTSKAGRPRRVARTG